MKTQETLTALLQPFYQINEDVINGNKGAVDMYLLLHQLSKVLDEIKEGIYSQAIVDMEKDKIAVIDGFKLEYREGAGRYDYSTNPEHKKLQEQIKAIEEQMKAAHKLYLQGRSIVDDNGEVVPIPAYKSNKPSINVQREKS